MGLPVRAPVRRGFAVLRRPRLGGGGCQSGAARGPDGHQGHRPPHQRAYRAGPRSGPLPGLAGLHPPRLRHRPSHRGQAFGTGTHRQRPGLVGQWRQGPSRTAVMAPRSASCSLHPTHTGLTAQPRRALRPSRLCIRRITPSSLGLGQAVGGSLSSRPCSTLFIAHDELPQRQFTLGPRPALLSASRPPRTLGHFSATGRPGHALPG